MARIALSPEEKESRKLARRAAKKANRKSLKELSVVAEPTKKGKGKTPFHLIEVATNNTVDNKKLASLIESGAPVKKRGYSMGHFIYSVPSSITEFPKHGTGEVVETKEGPVEAPIKTLTDCVEHVNAEKKAGTKINKRFIKLMVRNSELKRNVKKETLTALLTLFKIK